MNYTSEYVSPGHPDRLCDKIANEIVMYALSKDNEAFCAIECAVFKNTVFIDGRIAGGNRRKIITNEKIKEIARKVYADAGYGKHTYKDRTWEWHPFPEKLEIITNVDIELLSLNEREARYYSDDQNIVNGYALNSQETDFLPYAHYVSLKLGEEIVKKTKKDYMFGPDFKLLVQLKEENGVLDWERLTISIQHDKKVSKFFLKNNLETIINSSLSEMFGDDIRGKKFTPLAHIHPTKIYLNGAGVFEKGGPCADNGLSGKKLCLDFYGPDIPIGGGAIFGKDIHKIDVCGAYEARRLALYLVNCYGYHSVLTTLAWSPGEEEPYAVFAYAIDEFGTKLEIDNLLLPPKESMKIRNIYRDMDLFNRGVIAIKDIVSM